MFWDARIFCKVSAHKDILIRFFWCQPRIDNDELHSTAPPKANNAQMGTTQTQHHERCTRQIPKLMPSGADLRSSCLL